LALLHPRPRRAMSLRRMRALALPEIETPRLVLRLATGDDVREIVRFYRDNQAFLQPWEPLHTPYFFTEAHWQRQVVQSRDEHACDQALRLFLFRRDAAEEAAAAAGRLIGSLSFSGFLRGAAHACSVGYSLAEAEQGRGYMTEALDAAVGFAFEALHMHRIVAGYLPRNERSGRLLRRAGFVVEGYARDYLRINGRWEDHILTSRTNDAWTEPVE
jgi:ribosomal-protein-alanine N-acetyltransferase